MKTTIEKGTYNQYMRCEDKRGCEWISKIPYPMVSRGICPDCGGRTEIVIGRWSIITKKRLMITFSQHRYFEEVVRPPTPPSPPARR